VAVALPGAVGDPAPAALSWMPAGSRGGGDGALAPSRLSRLGVPIGELHAEEAARADALRTAGRQLEYVAGRVALRRALSLSGCGDREAFGEPLLSTDAGAVRMPLVRERDGESRLLGSISHTRGMCVAIVAGSDDRGRPLVAGAPNRDSDSGEGSSRGGSGGGYSTTRTGAARTALSAADPRKAWPAGLEAECGGGPRAAVGVDVERTDRRPMTKLSLRVLSEPERRDLQARSSGLAMDAEAELTLRFSIKEALYKALHPLLCTTIPWHAVRVLPLPDGTVAVDTSSPAFAVIEASRCAGGGRLVAQARWVERSGYFLTTAAVLIEG